MKFITHMKTHRIAGDAVRNAEIDSFLSQYPKKEKKEKKNANELRSCLRWVNVTLIVFVLHLAHFPPVVMMSLTDDSFFQLWRKICDFFGAAGAQKGSSNLPRLSAGVAQHQRSQSAHQGHSRKGGIRRSSF